MVKKIRKYTKVIDFFLLPAFMTGLDTLKRISKSPLSIKIQSTKILNLIIFGIKWLKHGFVTSHLNAKGSCIAGTYILLFISHTFMATNLVPH